jgi:hypothetical protein
MMTAEQYLQWKEHPLTQLFHQFLRDKRMELMEQWAGGVHCTPTAEGTAVLNAAALARAQCLQELADLEDGYISEFYRKPPKEETNDERGTV